MKVDSKQFQKSGFTPLEKTSLLTNSVSPWSLNIKLGRRNEIKNSLTGFTLMELMIGAGVLIIALVGLVAAFTGCFALGESATNLTTAINDAQCVMEEIRAHNIPSLITNEDWANWAATDLVDGGGGCTSLSDESIEVTYPAGIGADPLEVMVTVHWTERGRQKSTQVVTLVTER